MMASPDKREWGIPMTAFHDLSMPSITGEPVSFADFRGRYCLVVNVASR
jgi:glutathione peroxidase-family protein